jgi:hypothetical protein
MNVNLDSVTGIPYTNTLLNLGKNENIFIILLTVILGFYLLFSSLGGSSNSVDEGVPSSSSKSKSALEIMLWGIFVVLVLLNGMSYFFNINITASIKNLFGKTPELDVLVDPDTAAGDPNTPPSKDTKGDSDDANGADANGADTNGDDANGDDANGDDANGDDDYSNGDGGSSGGMEEVFHIPGNKYNFNDARAVCNAYDSRLANYKEVETAYNKGGDWCSYGWSEDQMALYPTQYEKWQNLQKIKGHKHDCGRPGVNGGFIDNKNVKFGVNCYGIKPKITEYEYKLMNNSSLYPKTRKEIEFDKKVTRYRDKIPDILVSPFNHTHWKEV